MRARRKGRRRPRVLPWAWAGAQVLLAAGFTGGTLTAVCLAGDLAGEELRRRGAFSVRFADIECRPPAGMSRSHFLQEVQYLGSIPDHFEADDTATRGRIVAAFEAHPRVNRVTDSSVGRRFHIRTD